MSDRDLDRLSRELRRWAERPGSRSPAAARARVLADLPHRRRRPAWRLAAGGAALAATALALVLSVGRRQAPVPRPPTPAADAQQMIVHQLSSGTKLYIILRSHAVDGEC